MSTRVLNLTTLTESQSGKFRTVNGALYFLDAVLGAVISRTNAGPPGSPSVGDAYIVDNVTGAWSGFSEDDIVIYYENAAGTAAWLNVSPPQGPSIYVDDEGGRVQFDGTNWVAVGTALSVNDVAASTDLVAADNGRFISVTDTATLTVPPESSVAFPLGATVTIFRETANAVTIAAGSGVTINGTITLSSQYDSVTLIKTGADKWAAS